MKLAGLKSVDNAHDESIWAAAWVPATDSRPALLLTGALDETVRLWTPDELSPFGAPIGGHCLGVVSVAAHPEGIIAASASLDSFVRVFDVDSNTSIASLEAPASEVWNMQFSPNLLGSREGRLCSKGCPDGQQVGQPCAGGAGIGLPLRSASWPVEKVDHVAKEALAVSK